MSNTEHIVRDIKDRLSAYYKVARKRFIDNVVQIGRYYLTTGPKTPLRLFDPAYISKLSAEQIEDIAGEPNSRKWKRKALEKQIKDLEAGMKILSRSAMYEEATVGSWTNGANGIH